MDILTHIVFGALVYNLFFQRITINLLLYAMFFAVLPDMDLFLSPLRRKFNLNYLEHRSGSHSYIMGILISAIIGGIYSLLTQQSFFSTWIIGSIFYGVHISLDLLNTTKIPCFYPISKKEYCFYVEKAGSGFTMITSLIYLVAITLVINVFQNEVLTFLIVNLYTIFTVVYYVYRTLTKILIKSRLNENQKYFPGVSPFSYYLYEKELVNNTLSLHLEKRSHILRKKLIYQNNATLTPQEMGFFEKGMELSLENYYYAKWTILPIFSRDEGRFSIRIFFLEPMAHSRAMYLQYDFDPDTSKIVDSTQSFGRFNQRSND